MGRALTEVTQTLLITFYIRVNSSLIVTARKAVTGVRHQGTQPRRTHVAKAWSLRRAEGSEHISE